MVWYRDWPLWRDSDPQAAQP